MSLQSAKMPSLKDKLAAQVLKVEVPVEEPVEPKPKKSKKK